MYSQWISIVIMQRVIWFLFCLKFLFEYFQVLHTNQFSVTKHSKVVSSGMGDAGLPGVFIMYELSPMMVKYTEKQRYFVWEHAASSPPKHWLPDSAFLSVTLKHLLQNLCNFIITLVVFYKKNLGVLSLQHFI